MADRVHTGNILISGRLSGWQLGETQIEMPSAFECVSEESSLTEFLSCNKLSDYLSIVNRPIPSAKNKKQNICKRVTSSDFITSLPFDKQTLAETADEIRLNLLD